MKNKVINVYTAKYCEKLLIIVLKFLRYYLKAHSQKVSSLLGDYIYGSIIYKKKKSPLEFILEKVEF